MQRKRTPTDILTTLCASLDTAKIPYCAVGGVALAIHEVARETGDIDLLVSTPHPLLADTLQRILTELDLFTMNCEVGVSSLFADSWIRFLSTRDDGFLAVKLSYGGQAFVDLIYLLREPLSVSEIIDRAEQKPLPGAPGRGIRIACVPDLIEMKKLAIAAPDRPEAKRESDKRDLIQLTTLLAGSDDKHKHTAGL